MANLFLSVQMAKTRAAAEVGIVAGVRFSGFGWPVSPGKGLCYQSSRLLVEKERCIFQIDVAISASSYDDLTNLRNKVIANLFPSY